MNINDIVKVTLTDYGIAILKKNEYSTGKFNEVTKRYTDELYSIMNIFGKVLYMGNPNQCFVNNKIELETIEV